jgi:hypothetical protein
LAGRRLATGVIAVPSRIRRVARAAAASRIRDLPAQVLLLDNVVPYQQRVPAGLLRPAGHLGEDLGRREFPEVRNVDRIPHRGIMSSGTDKRGSFRIAMIRTGRAA